MKKYHNYNLEIKLLIFSTTIVFISFILSLLDDKNFWFMRSGSIMVLLAVIVEYKLNQHTLQNINKKSRTSAISGFPSNLLNSKEHNKIAVFAHVFIIVGTLIWGYGDLFIKAINRTVAFFSSNFTK